MALKLRTKTSSFQEKHTFQYIRFFSKVRCSSSQTFTHNSRRAHSFTWSFFFHVRHYWVNTKLFNKKKVSRLFLMIVFFIWSFIIVLSGWSLIRINKLVQNEHRKLAHNQPTERNITEQTFVLLPNESNSIFPLSDLNSRVQRSTHTFLLVW